MVEPDGRVDLEGPETVRASLHRPSDAGLQIEDVVFRQLARFAVEFDRRGAVLDDQNQFFVQCLRRVRRSRSHLEALEQRSTAPAEDRDNTWRDRGGGKLDAFDRLAGDERHRYRDAGQLTRAARDLVFVDYALIAPVPWRLVRAARAGGGAQREGDQRRPDECLVHDDHALTTGAHPTCNRPGSRVKKSEKRGA